MADEKIAVSVSGGQNQGVFGAGSVVIENFTIYNRAPDAPEPAAEPIAACPYPGLAYFGPNEAHLFFGRDAAIARLAAAVTRQSFTALVGSSGSGKSSVVLAGLAPRLHAQGGWRFGHFRIGAELDQDPFAALARALVPLFMAGADEIDRLANTRKLAAHLQSGDLSLRDIFADSRNRHKGDRILLIADQFEEAFTQVPDEALRHRFIDVLLAGFPDPPPGTAPEISLIFTMRADFYGRALLHRPLADALQGHVENLGPMRREELREAILRPAEGAGVTFEPGLVETLLDDVESRPGSLPLLQFALREMWGLQQARRITRASYDTIGGVQGALARRAETIFADMTANGSDAQMEADFQRLFARLVTPGEGQEDTRRIAERTELGEAAWTLAQRLAGEANRLVVTNAPGPARETVEVVHEALIRNWPTLAAWINRDRAFLSWLRQIRPNLELWQADPSDDGPLLRGGILAQAADWRARRGDDFSPAERAYVEASVALRQREDDAREAARAAEITRQQQLAEAALRLAAEQRRRARLSVLGAVAGILLAGFGAWQAWQARENEAAANEAAARAEAAAEMAREQGEKANQEARSALRSRTLMLANLSIADTDKGNPERGLLLALILDPGRLTRNNFGLIQRADVPLLTVAVERALYAGLPLRRLKLEELINRAALSPDGRGIVTASRKGPALLWDAETGKQVGKLAGHQGEVISVAFSPDGRRIVTSSDDQTARLWDSATGQETAVLDGGSTLNGAAISPDGRLVATASSGGKARIWDVAAKTIILELTHPEGVRSVAFSPDGVRLVTGGRDALGRIWDVASGQLLQTLSGHTWAEIYAVAFSPDGSKVITASEDSTARIWDAATGRQIYTAQHDAPVKDAAFTPDGLRFVTATSDSTVRISDSYTLERLQTLRTTDTDPDATVSASPSGDGRRLLTASLRELRIWDIETGHAGQVLLREDVGRDVTRASFSPDGGRVVTASSTANVWDARTGAALARFTGHSGGVRSAAFSPDGKLVVTASFDGTVRLWEAATGRELRAFKASGQPPNDAAFSPDGASVVTAYDGGPVRVWDVASGAQAWEVGGFYSPPTGVAFSTDGSRLMVSGNGQWVRLWDVASRQEIAHPDGERQNDGRAAFSPDGRLIVTAAAQTARILDAATLREVRRLPGHKQEVIDVAFSADSQRIVTTSLDNTARIWDVATAREIHVLAGHAGPVNSAAFSPDRTRVVTASADGTARIWTLLPPGDAVWELAAKLKHRSLSAAEQREFFLIE